MTLTEQAHALKNASYEMMCLSTQVKDRALLSMAEALRGETQRILRQNALDVQNAINQGRNSAFIDRLTLSEKTVEAMANGLCKLAALPDPTGGEDFTFRRPNGLMISKRRVPLGVIGIIYESRPNVTADAIGLCLKSGNAVLLRGGSEAINSNIIIADILSEAAYAQGVPDGAVQLLRDTSRETAAQMMRLNGYIDVLIPRGGARLISSVVENATVPVIETGLGNCHTYIHSCADKAMAIDIVINAKTSRPAVCNAMETLLIHKEAAPHMLEDIAKSLIERNVELRGCNRARELVPQMKEATHEDYATEYDDYILAVKVVDGINEAIEHINKYGTRHSECIVCNDYAISERFLNEVDAAAVYVNASTRFTDGEEFGFGAEIGISTQKLHARGPMGLDELTSVKYIVRGNGQIR